MEQRPLLCDPSSRDPIIASWEELSHNSLGSLRILAQSVPSYGANQSGSSATTSPRTKNCCKDQGSGVCSINGSTLHSRNQSKASLTDPTPTEFCSRWVSNLSRTPASTGSFATLPPSSIHCIFGFLFRYEQALFASTCLGLAQLLVTFSPRQPHRSSSLSTLSTFGPHNFVWMGLAPHLSGQGYTLNMNMEEMGIETSSSRTSLLQAAKQSQSSLLQAAKQSQRETLKLYVIVTEVALVLAAAVLGAFGVAILDKHVVLALCLFGFAIGMALVGVVLLIWWCLNTREYKRTYVYNSQ